MRKIILLIMMLVAGFSARSQQFVFFCVNLGDHTDGNYVAEVIDGALKQLGQQDEFMIYIRGGVNKEGKVFDAVQISDREKWEEAKGLLDYIDRCTVLSSSEVDMLKRIFQSRYTVDRQVLKAQKPITIYWFGDEQYYKDHGRDLFLSFYFSVNGDRTWRNCYLYGENRQMKASSVQERLGANEYSTNNVTIK